MALIHYLYNRVVQTILVAIAVILILAIVGWLSGTWNAGQVG